MSYAPYSAYKDSGAPWLDGIPTTWNTLPFFSLAVPNKRKNTGGIEKNLLSLSYGRIIRKNIKDNSGLLPESFDTYQIVDKGHIVFRLTDLQNDKVSLRSAIAPEKGIITSAYLAIQFKDMNAGFANYLMRSYDKSKVFYEMGGGVRQSGKFEDLKWMPVIVPPKDEQTAITDFLDKKTAEIDDLIAKKEELLSLLAEQRTALITHAVTKGLDPNAPMKPSGIDWLGDVSEGWNIVQLRRVLRGISQGWSPSADDRVASLDEWAVLKAGCVNGGVYNSAEHKALPSNLVPRTDLEVQSGDILMCRASGSLHLIGSVAMVGETRPKLIFSDKTYRLEVETKLIDREFFTYAMSSHHMREQIINSVSGAEGMANNIPQSAVLSYVQAVPEIQIQKLIVRYLGGKLAKLTEIEASAKSAINVLNEYRTALITNAVTGKIKVA